MAQVLDGLFLMAAGALFLTPGLLTDVLALLLLVPPIRRAVGRWTIGKLLQHRPADIDADHKQTHDGPEERRWPETAREGPVIEGEFERLGETPSRRGNGASPA
jgi:UPF0716 protein FxsA